MASLDLKGQKKFMFTELLSGDERRGLSRANGNRGAWRVSLKNAAVRWSRRGRLLGVGKTGSRRNQT